MTAAARACFGIAFWGLLFALGSLVAAEPGSKEKIPLRILYVGHPGAERTSDFVGFLKQYFLEVDTANLAGFQMRDKINADVILLDYDGDGFKAPRFSFPEGYSQPTITIGVAGGLICSQNGLKTGYL